MASISTSSEVVGSSSMDEQPSTSREDEEKKEVDEQAQFEILHAIERFLEGGKFDRAAEALRRDINEKKLVPSRTDFEGVIHDQNYGQFLSSLSHLPSTSRFTHDTLPAMISRLSTLSDRAVVAPVKGLKLRLITNRRSALQRNNDVLLPARRPNLIHGNRGQLAMLKTKHSSVELLRAREMGSRMPPSVLPGEGSIDLMDRHFRIHAHLSCVYCVTFDRTENYLLSGADDNLVKVFNVNQAMLKFTYRGHDSEISDMSVSHCNQLVASASNDKTLRVWKLQNGETIHVFKHHTAVLTGVVFLPFVGSGSMRYLVSTGNDCVANFYRFNQETLEFPAGQFPGRDGMIYSGYERDQPGAKMMSISNSKGGHVVIIGESHGVIRAYRMHENRVEKLNDITGHTDRVDSLMWANSGELMFCSGSKDGTARIWRFQYGEWQQTVLSLSQAELIIICGVNATQNNPNSKNKYKVSMVCWTLDDSRLVTTGSDHSFRVWHPTNGSQLIKLSLHTEDAFLMCTHPIHPHLVISSGHDGLIAVWDVIRGKVVHQWRNVVEHGEIAPVLDLSLTRDATRFAIVDNKGHVSLYGLGTNKRKFPRAQFFFTDYHPIAIDPSGYAVDASTGMAPHLMPPARLTTGTLEEYPADVQAMVPGRDTGEDIDEASLMCAWLSRDIVPKMGENEMKTWAERQSILSQMESDVFNEEMTKERPSATPTPDAIVPISRRGNVRSSRPASYRAAIAVERALAQARTRENARSRIIEERRLNNLRRGVSMRYIGIDPDNDDDLDIANDNDDMINEEEEEEVDTDPSDTDYESDGERQERERQREREAVYFGTASRPRRRERDREVEVEMEEEEEEVEMDESSQHSRSERRRRRRGPDDDFGNDLSIDMFDLPSTSTGRGRGRREEIQERMERVEKPERSNGRNRRVRKNAGRDGEDEGEEMEEEELEMEDTVVREERSRTRRQPSAKDAWKFTFPDWMREVKRKRFPYVAQIGDHVVYFRQGHEIYLSEVERTKLYHIDSKMYPKSHIDHEEFAIVDDVKYILKPYRLTQMTLARTDSAGRRTGLTFTVKHHDMDNVPDFIIYREFYDDALAMELDVGDEIEAAIDDKWWCGTVDSININPSYPNAHWLSVRVMWNSGDDDALSPWDLKKNTTVRRADQPVLEDEATALGSVTYSDGDWPEGDDDGELTRRRIKRAINELGPLDTVSVFSQPVPLQEYYDYPSKVAYPMDLQTICERIDNQYYRRHSSLLQDIRHIALSAETYNLKESVIVRNAKVFVEALIGFANDPSIEDIVGFYDSCHDIADSELLEYRRRPRPEVNSEMLEMLQEEENARGNDQNGISPTRPGWIREAVEIIEELMHQPCARHFVSSADDCEELTEVWEQCDDLRTLCEKVRGNEMSTPKDIETAVHSLVSTAKHYNENRRSEIYKDSVALQSQFNHRFKTVLTKFESMQASVQATLGVSLERSMRRRAKEVPQHAYNTRRSDQTALTAVALAEWDEQPTSSRSAASHERGYYRQMNNGGGRGYAASEETEVSSSSSRRTTGRRSARNIVKVEEEEEMEEEQEDVPETQSRVTRAKKVIKKEEEEEEEAEEEENGIAHQLQSDDENGEEEEEEDDEEEVDDDDDDYEEQSVGPSSKKRQRVRKRKAESTEGDESPTASTSTSSSTRRSERKRKRARMSSGDEDEEENWRRGGGRKKKEKSRPTRSSARQSQQTYDERSDDDEEEEGRATPSVSQRGRQRKTRQFND